MKTKTFLVILSIIATFMSSCTVVPVNRGGDYGYQQQMPQGIASGAIAGARRMPYGAPQQRSFIGQQRSTGWIAGPVLHERWKYSAATGKVTKVSEEALSPDQARAQMRERGLEAFPNRIPIGGEMPGVRSNQPGN